MKHRENKKVLKQKVSVSHGITSGSQIHVYLEFLKKGEGQKKIFEKMMVKAFRNSIKTINPQT